jgi:hypothetical protein
MKAKEIGEVYGWYTHFMLLAKGDVLKIAEVVDMNHREAFMALSYLIDVNN